MFQSVTITDPHKPPFCYVILILFTDPALLKKSGDFGPNHACLMVAGVTGRKEAMCSGLAHTVMKQTALCNFSLPLSYLKAESQNILDGFSLLRVSSRGTRSLIRSTQRDRRRYCS